ncbi:MAG: signal peptidase I [Candidatus Eremiobacteraeota bacterium]|nr:signal peptidase I [Candidatus Eremiobacteraeota bacterium]
MLRQLHWRPVANVTLQIAVLGALLLAFFLRMPQVSGFSMAPRIASGEFVLINTVAYRMHTPERGDIIAFHHDGPAPQSLIKRVIGLPGDVVRIDRGTVYVNDRALAEPYVRFPDNRSFGQVTVPAQSLYVLGDNRAASDDSRFWGFVPEDRVIGKALAGIWPAGRIGTL